VLASSDLAGWTAIARSVGGGAMQGLGAFSVHKGPAGSLLEVRVVDPELATAPQRRFLRLEITVP